MVYDETLTESKLAAIVRNIMQQDISATPLDTAAGCFEFSGMVPSGSFNFDCSWILDTGASCHVCANPKLLSKSHKLSENH